MHLLSLSPDDVGIQSSLLRLSVEVDGIDMEDPGDDLYGAVDFESSAHGVLNGEELHESPNKTKDKSKFRAKPQSRQERKKGL